jgi:branched-subunit amino acid ABC-type transport system permease component
VAIAVLRYRLFAIDHIISRTLAYAALTLLLAAVYISVVMVLASPMAGRSNLAVAAATLAVAALFRPAQRSIQEMIDRHFNRRRYDLSRTIAEFGHRVQNETDPTQLERELVGVVQDILQPNTMSLWAMRRSARRSLG